tara:strand:+ start:9626 stop:13129 length:3504 start_codon:yes stop_codon:yes gene_type:complete
MLANQVHEGEALQSPAEIKAEIQDLDEFDGFYYGIIQFKKLPTDDEILSLGVQGIQLYDYMPSQAYYARINKEFKLTDYSNIRLVYNLTSFDRLNEDLAQNNFPDHALVDGKLKIIVNALSPKDVLRLSDYVKLDGGKVVSIDDYTRAIKCEVPVRQLKKLAELALVQFISPIDAPGFPENYKGTNSHRVAALTKSYTGLTKDLDGSGVNVMLQDDGVIGPHIDYAGRIGAQYITTNRGDHGDHTGGTIMGAGNVEPRYQGMAPAATIWVYGAAFEGYPGFDSIYNHYNKHNIRITSTSYSNGVNAGYTNLAQKLDDQVEKMKDLVHVFSAGNSRSAGSSNGWYTITGGHKVAKNVITVANLDLEDEDSRSSSQGPTRDGRIKPDIGAVGSNVMSTTNDHDYVLKSGTSMSCPGVAGTVTLLHQAYKELNSGATPESALMKAVVCNSADDVGKAGPDFTNGFGRINARKAFDVLNNKTYFNGSLSTGGNKKFTVNVGANDKLLKVMLVWLDPKGTVGSSRPLINDLDLEVYTGFSSPSLPLILDPSNPSSLAQEGRDSINNIEQVVIENPATGSYTIEIKGKSIPSGPQSFYVTVVKESDEIVVEYPVGGESLVPGEREMIRWSDASSRGGYDIEYSLNNGSTWTTLAIVSGSARFYEWSIPNQSSSQVLVRVVGGGSTGVSSAPFSIFAVPAKPYVQYACPDSIGLKWNAISGAKEYVVYQLGDKYMDSIGVTTANEFNLLKNCVGYNEGWFAVSARGNNGEIGRRSEAYLKSSQLFNCVLNNDIELVEFDPLVDLVRSCSGSNKINVGVKVKNNANVASSPFTLNLTVNGGTVIQENVTVAIASGTSTTITFTQAATLSTGANQIEVWRTSSSKDQNSCNDSLSTSIEYIIDQPVSTPLKTNFDNYTNCSTASGCEAEECKLKDSWHNSKNGGADDIDWRVNNGGTPSRNTGPGFDHTTSTSAGKYLYLEASGNCTQREAHLISPCFDLSKASEANLTFWYHMQGSSMGSLTVDAFVDGKWKMDVITPLVGNKGNVWYQGAVDMKDYLGKSVQFRFRGKTGADAFSDMAIDDIDFDIKSDVSVEGHDFMNQVMVYPQPASNVLIIKSELDLSNIKIFDLFGKVVFEDNGTFSNKDIDIQNLENGIYILELESNDVVNRRKIEILR